MSLLDFTGLSERQERFIFTAENLAQRLRANAAQADQQAAISQASVEAFRQSGLPALTLPEGLGGEGANLSDTVRVLQVLGRADIGVALAAAMQFHVIGGAAEAGSWPGVLERLATDISAGALLNSAASEPELGSPSHGGRMRTLATRTRDGWTLSGRKTWVTGAPALAYFIVTAAIHGADETGRFVVPAGTPGVRLEAAGEDFLALRGSSSDDFVLEDVRLPADALIPPGPPDYGASRAWFWAALAAAYLGVGQAALRELIKYATERVPTGLGRPISTLPKVREAIGRAELTLYAAQLSLHDAAARWDAQPGVEVLPHLAAAKSLCANASVTATDLAMRAAGAGALNRDLPLERLFRDARAGLVHPPSDDTTLEMIAAATLP